MVFSYYLFVITCHKFNKIKDVILSVRLVNMLESTKKNKESYDNFDRSSGNVFSRYAENVYKDLLNGAVDLYRIPSLLSKNFFAGNKGINHSDHFARFIWTGLGFGVMAGFYVNHPEYVLVPVATNIVDGIYVKLRSNKNRKIEENQNMVDKIKK